MTNQNDFVIDNGTGLAVRTDIQDALQALAGNSSGNSEPSVKYAYQWWADSNAAVMKLRNSANDGWIELFQLDGTLTLEDGSASTPALAFRDDLNTGIFSSAADTFNVATAGVERMELGAATVFNEDGADVDFRIESSGTANMFYLDAGNNRIGLNRETPLEMFEVGGNIYLTSNSSNANDGNALKFQTKTSGFSTSYGAAIHGLRVGDTSSYLRFDTGGQSEKMRLDSSGRLLIGKSTNRNQYYGSSLTGNLQVEGTDNNTRLTQFIHNQAAQNQHILVIGKSRGSSVGDYTVVQDDDYLGTLSFQGADGDAMIEGARIDAMVDGTPGNNDMPARLTFLTTADGASSTTERMRIDSSGNILIGHTSSRDLGGLSTQKLVIEDTSGNACIGIVNNQNTTGFASLRLAKSRGSSVGSNTAVVSGDTLGGIVFCGADGTDIASVGAQILAEVDGTPGSNDMPGRLEFHTTADSGTSPTERMRIDSNGGVIINATSNQGGHKLGASNSNGTSSYFQRTGNDGGVMSFMKDSSFVGSISVTSSATSFNTSSDYRLKENPTAISDGITRLKTLKPYRFNWKVDSSTTVDGFFAHEVTAVPEAIIGTKDEVDSNNKPVYQKIDHSKLVPLLVAAVQDLITKVETLEAA